MKPETKPFGWRLNRRIGWLLPALLAFVALADANQEEPPPVFVERVEVNVVNIEVFVTDSEGRPVAGLTKDDFEILEDGAPVEITNFFTVERQGRMLESLEKGELPMESTSAEPRLLPADQQLNLVVYVDQFNLRPFNRNRVLESLEDFLEERIRLGDNVMLVSAFRGPEVVVPLTRDRQRVVDGLRQMGKAATYRQLDEARLRRSLKSMEFAAAEGSASSARNFVRSYVRETRNDVERSAGAIRDTVRSLGGLPGRKALLYVSEGLPQRPGEELYQQLQARFGTPALREASASGTTIDPSIEALAEDQTRLFDSIVREANAHQVTFYTFDASGPGGSSHLSAESAGSLIAGGGGRTAFDGLREQNLQEPLIEMAETTGGRSFLDTFNFADALSEVGARFDLFYSLGYTPPATGDGQFHRVKVRLKERGLKVRHRTGYVDKPAGEKIADRTISSLLFDLEKNPQGVAVDFGPAKKKSRGKYHLPVLVRLRIDQVTMLPNGDQEEGRLKIYVVIQDDEGGISDLHEADYPVQIPSNLMEEARGKELGYTTTLLVRPGLLTVAVGVWDELAGTDSFVHKQVRVEKIEDS